MNGAGEFQRRLFLRLAAWSAASAAGGAALVLWGGTPAAGAGIQAAAWGAAEAAVALAGLRRSRRGRPGGEDRLRRALWAFAGLGLLCLAAALVLLVLPGRGGAAWEYAANWRAQSWGLAAQGAFLFFFGLLHARSAPPLRARLRPFAGDEHRPFLLAGGRPAALLVHGFPGTPAEMLPLGLSLQKAGWTARGLLLPGCGADLASPESRSALDWARCVGAALGAMRCRHSPVLLVGFSLGGALAVAAASAAAPDGLVLLAPFWRSASGWQRAAAALRPVLPRYFYPLRRADFRDPGTREFLQAVAPDVDPEEPGAAAELRRLGVPLWLLAEVLASGRRSYRSAARVRCPTLIVQGSRDRMVLPDFTRRLSSRFRKPARYLELPAGHRLLAERDSSWEEVERAVLEFAGALRYAALQPT
jgi:carboxylesterase